MRIRKVYIIKKLVLEPFGVSRVEIKVRRFCNVKSSMKGLVFISNSFGRFEVLSCELVKNIAFGLNLVTFDSDAHINILRVQLD